MSASILSKTEFTIEAPPAKYSSIARTPPHSLQRIEDNVPGIQPANHKHHPAAEELVGLDEYAPRCLAAVAMNTIGRRDGSSSGGRRVLAVPLAVDVL